MTPSELATLADDYWRIYQERLAADKVSKDLKSQESKLEARLIAEMRENDMTSVGGRTVRLAIDVEPEYTPAVTDWQEVHAHILATQDFSLLEKRIGRAACKERWAANETVPGVSKFPGWKLRKSEVKK